MFMAPAKSARKSVIASGLLSFFFGPLGWLYAAPWPVAIGASGAYVLACAILPTFMIVWLLGITAPISALAGVFYAIGFNMAGARTPLFGKEKDPPRLGA
jgi:hypothetical protein